MVYMILFLQNYKIKHKQIIFKKKVIELIEIVLYFMKITNLKKIERIEMSKDELHSYLTIFKRI